MFVFFNFKTIANLENEEKYAILLVRDAQTSYLRMNTKFANFLKNLFEEKLL